jgi:hypothetical protein
MKLGRLLTRRGVLALVASLLVGGALVARPASAARRAPDVKGEWNGNLSSELLGEFPFTLNVAKQNKKNGKISGTGSTAEGDFTFKGKIKPNGKLKVSFETEIDGQPITIKFDIQVTSDGNSAEGSYTATGQGGIPLDSGSVFMDKVIEE